MTWISEHEIHRIEERLDVLKQLLEHVIAMLRAPVRIKLDTAHAVKAPQPIPAQKGP